MVGTVKTIGRLGADFHRRPASGWKEAPLRGAEGRSLSRRYLRLATRLFA